MFADPEIASLLAVSLDPEAARAVMRKLDTVDAVYREIVPTHEHRALPDYALPQRALPLAQNAYDVLRGWLEARPGDDNRGLRTRLLQHTKLKADVIDRLPSEQQRLVYRLIARGTLVPGPEDKLHEAAENKDGAAAVIALRELAASDRKRLAALERDMVFARSIEQLRDPVEVGGVPVVPYHLCLRMWGRSPTDADPLRGTVEAVNPDAENSGPLTAEERLALDRDLFAPAIAEVRRIVEAPEIQGRTMSESGDLEKKSQLVQDTLIKWDRIAVAKHVTMLRREQIMFGPELEKRYAQRYQPDLRTWIYQKSGPNNRSGSNRVLGTEHGAAVGFFNGKVVMADDAPADGKMNLIQALREVASDDGRPLYEWGSVSSRELGRRVRDGDREGVLSTWREFEDAVAATSGEIKRLTGRRVRAIDLMRNAYREHSGDLEGWLAKEFEGEALAEIRTAMGLRNEPASDESGGEKPPTIESQAERTFVVPAGLIWAALGELGTDCNMARLGAARIALDVGRSLPPIVDADHPAPPPGTVEENPPQTLNGWYRKRYGTTPELHAMAVVRALGKSDDIEVPVTVAAETLGLDPVVAAQEVATTDEAKPVIDDSNRHLVRGRFDVEEAEARAKKIWEVLHGHGELHHIETELYGDCNDEEQRLIRVAFRRLSGGHDLHFYIQQAIADRKRRKEKGGYDPRRHGHDTGLVKIFGPKERLAHDEEASMVGGTGTTAGATATMTSGGQVLIAGGDSELERALAVASTGELDATTRVKTAAMRGDSDYVLAILDEIDRDERAKIMANGAIMNLLYDKLSQSSYERAFKTLSGQADLADAMYSRSHGGSWTERHITGGTDEGGMRRDIAAYVHKMRMKYDREVRDEIRDRDPPPPAKVIDGEIERRIRDACAGVARNASFEGILRDELSTSERIEMTSTLINAGEARDWAVAAGADSGKILAELRAMPAAERQQKLADPEYLRILGKRLPDEEDYRDALNALRAVSDVPQAGNLADLDEHTRTGEDVEGGERDKKKALATLVSLSPAEHRALQADPQLQLQLMSALDDEGRAIARELLLLRAPGGGDAVEPDVARAAELDLLVAQSIARIRIARGRGWMQMLEHGVAIYQLDLGDRGGPEREGAKDAKDAKIPGAAALRMRIWKGAAPYVSAFANEHRDDSGKLTKDAVTPEQMVAIMRAAILHEEDPSDALVAESIYTTREKIAELERSGSPLADYAKRKEVPGEGEIDRDADYDTKNLKRALYGASDDHVIRQWTNVVEHPPAGGGETMKQAYARYRRAADAAEPAATPSAQPETAASGGAPPAQPAAPDATLLAADTEKKRFLEFVIAVSSAFEQMLLPFMGDDRSATTASEGPKIRGRDNKRYNDLAEIILERIPKLPPELIGTAIEIQDKDRWMLFSDAAKRARNAVAMAHLRGERRLRHTGAQTRRRSYASDEKFVYGERSILYERELAKAQQDGLITAAEAENLKYLGGRVDDAQAAYQQALQRAAGWASLIAGVVVTVAATILTGGLALGPVSMLAVGAATAALSASAKSMVNEEILDGEWDDEDAADLIAKEVITGLVTMGTTFYAQKLLAGLGNMTTLSRQANATRQILAKPPKMWRMFLNEASEEVTSEMMSGVVEAGLAATDPAHWMHGTKEGAETAKQAALARLAATPKNAVQGAVTSLLTAGATRVLKRGGGADVDVGSMTRTQRRVDIRKNLRRAFGDQDEKVIATLVEWAMKQDGKIDWSKAPADLLRGYLDEMNEVAVETHTASAHRGDRSRRSERDLERAKTELSKGERSAYRDLHDRASETDPYVSIDDFHRIRTDIAKRGLAEWQATSGKVLAPPQAQAFVRWVRAAGSADELSVRAKTDPLSVPEVADAKPIETPEPPPPPEPAREDAGDRRGARTGAGANDKPHPIGDEKGDASFRVPENAPAVSERARAAREGLDDSARDRLDEIVARAENDGQRILLERAVAAGNSLHDVHALQLAMSGMSDTDVLRTFSGVGVIQFYQQSCVPASYQIALAEVDPVYALKLRNNPEMVMREQRDALAASGGAQTKRDDVRRGQDLPPGVEDQLRDPQVRAMVEDDAAYSGEGDRLGIETTTMVGGDLHGRLEEATGGRYEVHTNATLSFEEQGQHAFADDQIPFDRIDAALDAGMPVIVGTKRPSGHAQVIIGRTVGPDGAPHYIVADPMSGSTTRLPRDMFELLGVQSVTIPAVGDQASRGRTAIDGDETTRAGGIGPADADDVEVGAPSSVETTAAMVPGSDFRGRTGSEQRDAIETQAHATFEGIAAGVQGVVSVERVGTPDTYLVHLDDGTAITVRVMAGAVPGDAVARTVVNATKEGLTTDSSGADAHVKGRFVVQLSQEADPTVVARALAHELGEIMALRETFANDETPGPDALTSGPLAEDATLSPNDRGRAGEIRVLAAQIAAGGVAAERARRELHALVDHLGLRADTPDADRRRQLLEPHLDQAAMQLLADVGRPRADLSADDQASLDEIRDRATEDIERERERARYNRPIGEMPDAGAERVDRSRAEELAAAAAETRAQRSAATLKELQDLATTAPDGDFAELPYPLQIGGGAALAARNPGHLLVDARGRWQADASEDIAQTAQQLAALRDAGFGDPSQFAAPGERVPLAAIQFMEDSLAAQGPLVDGHAWMDFDAQGRTLVKIQPSDGSDILTFRTSGPVAIATGFPGERIPGTPPRTNTPAAVEAVRARLADVASSGSLAPDVQTKIDAALAAVSRLSGFEPGHAEQTLAAIHDPDVRNAVAGDPDLAKALEMLDVDRAWRQMRADDEARGGGRRLVLGDEANGVDFDPTAASEWLIAGTGGTGISAAEIILAKTKGTDVKVMMLGRELDDALKENDQFRKVVAEHGDSALCDKLGIVPAPDNDGRFQLDVGHTIGLPTVDADGNYEAGGHSAPGFIGSIGRDWQLPAPIAAAVTMAQREGRSIEMELMTHEGHYLGYRIEVNTSAGVQRFEVTGAASRFPPTHLITDPAVRERTEEVDLPHLADMDAPGESGNFPGGFVASATQAARYGRQRRARENKDEKKRSEANEPKENE